MKNLRTIKNLVSKNIPTMTNDEMIKFSIKCQSVLADILSNELKKEIAYQELKAATNYANRGRKKDVVKEEVVVEEIYNPVNNTVDEIACGLDLDFEEDYNTVYYTEEVIESKEISDLSAALAKSMEELKGSTIDNIDKQVIEAVNEDTLKYWMNGANQLDGYAIVDGKQLFFQASSMLVGPTVIGDWKYNGKIKDLIESKIPNFFKPKWSSIDEYKVYTKYKGEKCMVTALNFERTKYMGYIDGYAWIWDLNKMNYNGQAFKPLITPAEDLINNRRHDTKSDRLESLRSKYCDLISTLVSMHKAQVKSGKKSFPRPTSATNTNTNEVIINNNISDDDYVLKEFTEEDYKNSIKSNEETFVFKDAETNEDVNVKVNTVTNKISIPGLCF